MLFSACSSRHVSIGEDREVVLSKKSSDALYKYAKEDPRTMGGKSGFYPLPNHLDSLAARIILAQKATKSIQLQYYTYYSDTAGSLLMNELIKAADRGVKVDILIDDMEISELDDDIASLDSHKNINFYTFNPTNTRKSLHYVEIGLYANTLGKRMHNKAFIVDNSMAVFGGRNIGDSYFGLDEKTYFIDNDMLVVGEFVNRLTNEFEYYLASKFSVPFKNILKTDSLKMRVDNKAFDKRLEKKEFSDLEKAVLERKFIKSFLNHEISFYFSNAELYYDMPNKVETDEEDMQYHIQGKVDTKYIPKKSMYVVNPYFIPSPEMIAFIKDLRKKGVEIYVITNSLESTDTKSVYAYYSWYQAELLNLGVHLYETMPPALNDELKHQAYNSEKIKPKTALHAKTMIIDDKYFIIGSRNLDPRSRNLNTELVAIIENEELALFEKKVFDFITQKNNAYELSLECKKDKCEVAWKAEIDGKMKKFHNDADAGVWDSITIFFARLFPIEGLL